MNKKIIFFIVLIIAAFLSWNFYYKKDSSTATPAKRPRNSSVAVETAPVQKTTIRDTGTFSGTLLPDSQFIVAPKISGRLEKIFVDIGDRVSRGKLIAHLDDDEFVQQVEQAKAELDVAKANIEENLSTLSLAQREYDRAKALRGKKIVSESELDVAEAQYKAKEAKEKVLIAQSAQKEAALKAATVRLEYTRIRASWENGKEYRVVGERFVDQGAMLKSNDPIVSIISINPLTAVIHVIERDYPRIKIGQQAVITTDAFPNKTFNGTIQRISPILKESSRQAQVQIMASNPRWLLKPGMFVRVEIEFAMHTGATVVPISSLVKRDDSQGVFLIDRETMKARFIPLKLGIINGDHAEVVSPPLSGLVVTMGQHLLEDGTPVLLPGEQKEPSPGKKESSKADNYKG
ncbi:MAG: efflux RND transporter periplasmic adaptor subunit [Syntrophaceae bacterium]|nr:efflux RND transporter periplasmic adaptor subunit [Syntrophaceae bacterium]